MAELLANLDDLNWQSDAACSDTEPSLFFPVGETGRAIQQIEDAKKICGQCAVQATCLEYALNTRQDYGIWGGTTENERLVILRNRRQRVTA